jgi:hypothetical protein
VQRWSESRILAALRRDARRRGHPPSAEHWRIARKTRPSTRTVQEHFGGSWSNAITAAGLQPQGAGRSHRMEKWTAAEILAALRAWSLEHGRLPTYRDWEHSASDHPSSRTVAHACGSWAAALGNASSV